MTEGFNHSKQGIVIILNSFTERPFIPAPTDQHNIGWGLLGGVVLLMVLNSARSQLIGRSIAFTINYNPLIVCT